MISTREMHKSAIIYRDDKASYVYVCFHCGYTLNTIDETLLHIESHFQVVNISVDKCNSGENICEYPSTTEPVDIKIHFFENNDFPDSLCSTEDPVESNKRDINYFENNDFPDSFCSTEDTVESNKRDYRCKICHSIFASKFLIRMHILKIHIQEQLLKCIECSKTYTNVLDFERHLIRHIEQGKINWKCITDGIENVVNWSDYEEYALASSPPSKEFLKIKKSTTKHNERRSTLSESRTVKRTRKKASSLTLPKNYKCHKCPKLWRHVNELKRHLKTHEGDNLLQLNKCKECDTYFKSNFDLRLHVLGVHFMIETFNCNTCSAQFKLHESKQFEEHLREKNQNLWTSISDGIYHQQNDFTKYEENDSFTDELYPCEFCAHKFYIESNLDLHMKSMHSSQRRLQCGKCFSIFTTPKYYYAHQLEHQRVGPNIIERDDNVLLDNLNVLIDERIIYEADELCCLICNSKFVGDYDIRSHIRKKHVYKMFPPPLEPKNEFSCDLCGMRLKSKGAVRSHMWIHTNTKSHACTICCKKFRQNADRIIHERQHTGEKPFQCHQCGKGFISQGLLTAHKKSHDDSTYPCHICGRVFNLPSGYRRHIQIHRQDRAFQCTICMKSFTTRLYLTKHMAIHSEKKYQCRFCELKFNTSDGRRQHHRHKHQQATSFC